MVLGSFTNLHASSDVRRTDILGLNGSDEQNSQNYSQQWQKFCRANFNQVNDSAEFRSITEHVSAAILQSFDHCIDELSDRTIRCIVPSPNGAGFTIHVERHGNGAAQSPEISGIDMLDTNATQGRAFLPISNCEYENKPLTVGQIVKPRDSSNQLTVRAPSHRQVLLR